MAGDFNNANSKKVMPDFYQHITCPARGAMTLDHCHSLIKDGCKAQSLLPFDKSDHAAILLMPKYKQRLKQEALDALSDVAWDIFKDSSDSIDMFADVVTGFIDTLVISDIVPKVSIKNYPDQKPWVDTVRDALNKHTAAYNSGLATGNMDYKTAAYDLRRVVNEAKRRYGEWNFRQADTRCLARHEVYKGTDHHCEQ
ncbi:hypothetical protein N1851_028913 [Merluccius polli]|uniref:Uncharacterized protein n=1 Tax=Merluccius polli TaxID=89951 RepID=A0AA47NR51_MERPO|nr:hypothetical protein N1851_028913 [Merluccius polli]